MTSKMGLSSPWVTYARKVHALFAEDPDIQCVWDDEDITLKLYVNNALKADALEQLFPETKDFGNVTMEIAIIPANDNITKSDLIKTALAGNPIVSYVEHIDVLNNPIDYIVFEKEVIQYFNDNLGDIHGVESTLYEDLAREIFEEHDGVFFCTDIDDFTAGLEAPLGEWP